MKGETRKKLGKILVVLVLFAGLILVGGKTASAELLFLSNFDDGEKSTTNAKDFGAWDKDPDDPTQTCVASFDPDVHYGDEGMSLHIDYDVDSPNPAYNGFWMKLESSNASEYENLAVSVRGEESTGFTTQVVLELKNTQGKVGKYLLKGITSEWNEFIIPLSEFSGLQDLTSVSEWVVVFDDMRCTKKKGAVYIDDVYVE